MSADIRSHPVSGQPFLAGRSSSLSVHIVADVRDALLGKRLKSGDFIGTEKDLAARFGVSRIVARDALRTLEALGIVEIRMGKGGGARIAQGNPRLFAEALAVQLDLTGVSVAKSWTRSARSRRSAPSLPPKTRPPTTSPNYADCWRKRKPAIGDLDLFTRLRAISIWRWRKRLTTACWWSSSFRSNTCHGRAVTVTATSKLARHILDIHTKLADLIELRDAARRAR